MRGDPLDFLQSYAMRGWFVFKISCTWSIIVGPIKSVFSLSLLSVVAFRSVSLIQILESTRRELLNFPGDTFSNLSKLLLFFHSPPFFPSRTRFSRTSSITLAIYPKPVLHIRIISPRFAPLINATFLILWKKKNYQFLRWPFAIGRARTRVGGVNRSTSLSTRNSSQFPVEEIERSAWSNPANWIPSLDGQKQWRVPSPGCFSPRSALFRRPLFLHVSRSVDSATVRFWVGHRLSKFQNASSSSLPPCLSLPLRSVSAVTPRYRRKSSPNELGSDRALYKVLTDVPSVIWELVTGGRRQRRDNEKVTDEWTEIIVVC